MSRYIDADALIEKFKAEHDWSSIYIVGDIPIADVVEVVHGEWIYNKTSTLWECSNCHDEEIRTTDYCPHCGAKMNERRAQ